MWGPVINSPWSPEPDAPGVVLCGLHVPSCGEAMTAMAISLAVQKDQLLLPSVHC